MWNVDTRICIYFSLSFSFVRSLQQVMVLKPWVFTLFPHFLLWISSARIFDKNLANLKTLYNSRKERVYVCIHIRTAHANHRHFEPNKKKNSNTSRANITQIIGFTAHDCSEMYVHGAPKWKRIRHNGMAKNRSNMCSVYKHVHDALPSFPFNLFTSFSVPFILTLFQLFSLLFFCRSWLWWVLFPLKLRTAHSPPLSHSVTFVSFVAN